MSTKNVSRNCKKKRSASARFRTANSVLVKKISEGRQRRESASSVRPSRRQDLNKKESGELGTRRTSRERSMKETLELLAKKTKGKKDSRPRLKAIKQRLRNIKESIKQLWKDVSVLKISASRKSKSA